MKVCDRCIKSPEDDHPLSQVTVVILKGAATAYSGRADMCDDCIKVLAGEVNTPEMVPVKYADLSMPVAKPETASGE